MFTNFSSETLTVLRNCQFSGGVLDGVSFVRCIPIPSSYNRDGADGWELPADLRTAMALRVVSEVNEKGVYLANNPAFGGDYVRVNTDTQTYRLICHMKS